MTQPGSSPHPELVPQAAAQAPGTAGTHGGCPWSRGQSPPSARWLWHSPLHRYTPAQAEDPERAKGQP